MSLTTLCAYSMIAFACVYIVVTCSWFGLNAIIVLFKNLFELTFESAYTPIIKYNKLRSRVTCQPGVMKQILDGCCWLICGFDNFKPAIGWIYHCDCKQRVCFGWCPYCKWNVPTRSTQTLCVRLCYFGWDQSIFLTIILLLCHLTYLTSGTSTINVQHLV
jgi:hypothetical protein